MHDSVLQKSGFGVRHFRTDTETLFRESAKSANVVGNADR
jgi:hypothetical protein